jgi:hypothetical protein
VLYYKSKKNKQSKKEFSMLKVLRVAYVSIILLSLSIPVISETKELIEWTPVIVMSDKDTIYVDIYSIKIVDSNLVFKIKSRAKLNNREVVSTFEVDLKNNLQRLFGSITYNADRSVFYSDTRSVMWEKITPGSVYCSIINFAFTYKNMENLENKDTE